MENGVNKYWTPGKELEFEVRIGACQSFAQRHMAALLRDILKYDGRSKEGKRAIAQARLRIAVASDADLKELAELQVSMEKENPEWIPGLARAFTVAERLGELEKERAKIRAEGVNKKELLIGSRS